MSKISSLAAFSMLLLAAGCADPDSVLFVTVTSIGIDADMKPANITIGYDRYEGYIGPVYETGAIPPVVARIESNLEIFNPEIRQVYATGEAAKLVTGAQTNVSSEKPLSGNKRLAFFGTGTNIGLKVAFMANTPESISFGYKRKEFSFIPMGKKIDKDTGKQTDVYGSVLASIDMNVNTPSLTDTKLGVSQFFATGIAAEQLASTNIEIRKAFKLIAEQAITLRRDARYLDPDAVERAERIISAIERLGDSDAIALSKNPPTQNPVSEEAVRNQDPNNRRFTEGGVARPTLVTRADTDSRSAAVLTAWERALGL